MRKLTNLDNLEVSKGYYPCRKVPDRKIEILSFGKRCRDENKMYIIEVLFSGYLYIKEMVYRFRFTLELTTDKVEDAVAVVREDLEPVLNMVKNDFYAEDSNVVRRIMEVIIAVYSDNIEFMSL